MQKPCPLGPDNWVPVGRVLTVMLTTREYRKLKEKLEQKKNGKAPEHQEG